MTHATNEAQSGSRREGVRAWGARLLRLRLLVAALAVVLLVAGVVAVLNNYEVVAKGKLLDYATPEVRRIRLFDRVTVYAEPEVRPTADVFHSYILITISSTALLAAAFLHFVAEAARPRAKLFFVLTWLGAGYLAADELMGGHETIGHNLQFLRDLPLVDRPDDAVVAIYVLAALVFVAIFRSIVFASRGARAAFGAAVVLAVVAAGADLANVHRLEELLEPLASLAALTGFVILTLRQLVVARLARPEQAGWL